MSLSRRPLAILCTVLTCAQACRGQEKPPPSAPAEAHPPAPGHWPQWRGPNRDNVCTETGLLKEWPEGGPKLLWKMTGIGDGVSSVSVAGGLIFTVGYRGESEVVTALNGAGEIVWSQPIGPAEQVFKSMRFIHQRQPTLDDDRLYVTTMSGGLLCLRSVDGHVLWQKDYKRDFEGASPFKFADRPLVDGNHLICAPGGPRGTVLALDKGTGSSVWRSAELKDAIYYPALLPAEIEGVHQYIVLTLKSLAGIAAKDGKLLWRVDYPGKTVIVATPIYHDGIVVSKSWGLPDPCRAFHITRVDPEFRAQEIYSGKQLGTSQYGEVIRVGNYLYAAADRSLTCVEFRTGKVLWQDPSVGQGSVASADGHLVVRGLKGDVALVEAIPLGYVEKGRFSQPGWSEEPLYAPPVIAGGRLYLRALDALFCYDLRGEGYKEPAPIWNIHGHVPATPIAPETPPARADLARVSDAVFVPTPEDVVQEMLKVANVTKDDVVYDLGSGDGRIVIAASVKYRCRSVGYEVESELVKLSRLKAEEAKVDSLVTIEGKDLFAADLGPATVITLYLGEPNNKRLLPRLQKLKPGVRIVSHAHLLGEDGPKPDQTKKMTSKEDGVEHTIYLWTVPLKVGDSK